MFVTSRDNSFLGVLVGIPLKPTEVRCWYESKYRCQLTVYIPSVELGQKTLELRGFHCVG